MKESGLGNVAPWSLKGDAIIISYLCSSNYQKQNAHLPDFAKDKIMGGMCSVIFANYKESPVGPYREMMFLSSRFSKDKKQKSTITKCYVDSKKAQEYGNLNWGVNKEMANLGFGKSKSEVYFNAATDEGSFFHGKLRKTVMVLPLTTAFYNLNLYQEMNGNSYLFKPKAKSVGRIARGLEGYADPYRFPDIFSRKINSAFYLPNFSLTVPKAKICKL